MIALDREHATLCGMLRRHPVVGAATDCRLDTRGRGSTELTRAEKNVHLWKPVAEGQNCFDRPFRSVAVHRVCDTNHGA